MAQSCKRQVRQDARQKRKLPGKPGNSSLALPPARNKHAAGGDVYIVSD
jgi:hypothetical protein